MDRTKSSIENESMQKLEGLSMYIDARNFRDKLVNIGGNNWNHDYIRYKV